MRPRPLRVRARLCCLAAPPPDAARLACRGRRSSDTFVCTLFDFYKDQIDAGNKKRTPSVSMQFNNSLTELIQTMSKCTSYFVRCVKPNRSKASMQWEDGLCLDQLRSSGMLETIRIRRAGYPSA